MQFSRESLEKLWDETTPKLFGYLVNTLHDKALAEDIFQSTWTKTLDALPLYQDRGIPFSAWLFAIARNECKLYWRKGNHEVVFDAQEHDVATEPAGQDSLLAEQIMSRLPEDDRELLRLRYIADLPMNDIAKILQTNSVAVRVRIHRALKRAHQHV
ncbi:MAG: sigma-70 family RNA polymerase sigma factor [Patescibacteria group bacterium]